MMVESILRPHSETRRLSNEDALSVLQCIPNFILVISPDYKIIYINHVVPGLTVDQVVGQDALLFVAPEFHELTRNHWEKVLATGERVVYETPGLGPDGTPAHYTGNAGPFMQGDKIAGIVVSTLDTTDRKRYEEAARDAEAKAQAAVNELAEKNRLLDVELNERATAEKRLREQQEAFRAVSTPILQVWDGVLALPVVGAVDQERASQMMERLLHEIVRTQARFAILDLTGVNIVDTATAGYILGLVRASALLGSRCLVSGIAPAVVQTMVHLDLDLEGFETFSTLRDALRYAISDGGAVSIRRRTPGM